MLMINKLSLSLISVLCICGFAAAQNKQVSGRITNTSGEPIVGATVVVDGTTQGTTSDTNGAFTVTVPQDGSLTVSYIGYQTATVNVAGKTAIEIQLKESSQQLENVIVVAFGTAKKEAFTGSAAVVGSDEIAQTQTSNVVQALAGKVSGVQLMNNSGQPGAAPQIRIRGFSSINASQEPLYIVDGIPFDGDLSSINQSDIESMTVLKDAASTALYGSRGANGVVMLTTKKGKRGDAVINLDAKWGVNSRAVKPYDYISSPAGYYENHYRALYNYATADDGLGLSADDAYRWANTNLFDADNTYGLGYNVYTLPEGEPLIDRNGKLNPSATLGRLHTASDGSQYYLTPDDWEDEAFDTSLRQEYNVSASAANDRGSFFASFGYLDDEGIVQNSYLKRYTARLRSDYQLKKWLKIGGNVGYSNFKSRGVYEDASATAYSVANLFAAVTQVAPIYPVYLRGADGSILYDSKGYKRYDYGSGDAKDGIPGLERPAMGGSNALSSNMLDIENMRDGNTLTLTGFTDVSFLKHFKFTFNGGINLDEIRTTGLTNPYYGQYASMNGIINKTHTRQFSYNLQQLLTYSNRIGAHSIDAMIGHENYFRKYYLLSGSKHDMISQSNLELAGAISLDSANSYDRLYNTEGYFGRVMYDYDGRYFANVSYRRDASSRFDPSCRWGNFWSMGAAWILSRESWFEAGWVDLLKIKVSYGSQGNDGIGNYRYADIFDIVNSDGHIATVFQSKGNRSITWETNSNVNAGVEFGLFGERLNGSIDYFYRKTTDMLSKRPVPGSMGYSSYYDNIGDMRNSGIEINLNGVVCNTKDLFWDVDLNLTHFTNKITRLPAESSAGYRSGIYWRGIGNSIYDYYLRRYAGVDRETGLALYYRDEVDEAGNPTGKVTTTDDYSSATYYQIGKSPIPAVYGGIGTSLRYRNIDFSIHFTYSLGGYVYDQGYQAAMGVPSGASNGINRHRDILKSWSPENPDSDIPRFNYNDLYTAATSDRFLTKGSYLNLQDINLGYTLPTRFTEKFGVGKLRIFVSCDNVAYWSKRRGLDPRQEFDGSTSQTLYSPLRVISGGINLQF